MIASACVPYLLCTLRPGKTLPGVAGMVTTICSVTRPSSRFHTNILTPAYLVELSNIREVFTVPGYKAPTRTLSLWY